MRIYLIGSLRNPEIPHLANRIRELGFDVFDDWFAAGPKADDCWREYEQIRGRTFTQALGGRAAHNVFQFDRANLEAADIVVLALPAGKSGHLELGWAAGQSKPTFVLLDNPDRWDVMYQFATAVADTEEKLLTILRGYAP